MNQWPIQKRLLPTKRHRWVKVPTCHAEGDSWFCSCYHWDLHHTLTLGNLVGYGFNQPSAWVAGDDGDGWFSIIHGFSPMSFILDSGFHYCSRMASVTNPMLQNIRDPVCSIYTTRTHDFFVESFVEGFLPWASAFFFFVSEPESTGIDLFVLQLFTKVVPWTFNNNFRWRGGRKETCGNVFFCQILDRRCCFLWAFHQQKQQNEISQSIFCDNFMLFTGYLFWK